MSEKWPTAKIPIQSVSIFLAGCGRVGASLLRQIEATSRDLREGEGLELRLCGLADSKHIAIDAGGLPLTDWRPALDGGIDKARDKAVGTSLVGEMGRLALPRAILVDCTASADVAASYKEALAAGASVVCANKIANSGPLPYYRELRVLAASGGLAFRYGANVGAGLPVISTLQDLVATGDRVFKIEAVLSGTLSYLFNNFVGDRSFSSLVREAMDLGFTEPDPRVDLSALDAARKTLILAREIGYAMELADVEVAPLCPPSCDGQSSIGDFLSALGAADGFFEGLKRSAAAQGNSLRYVSSVSEGKAQISLRSVDAASPFAALRSNDNLVAFWTARYAERPLILQGPGAGAEVTAAGLLADILRCARKS